MSSSRPAEACAVVVGHLWRFVTMYGSPLPVRQIPVSRSSSEPTPRFRPPAQSPNAVFNALLETGRRLAEPREQELLALDWFIGRAHPHSPPARSPLIPRGGSDGCRPSPSRSTASSTTVYNSPRYSGIFVLNRQMAAMVQDPPSQLAPRRQDSNSMSHDRGGCFLPVPRQYMC